MEGGEKGKNEMLLIDPSGFSVYRVSKMALNNVEAVERTRPMPFLAFENAARKSYSTLIMETARYPTFRVRTKAIVFVRLRDGKGYAWASPIAVKHAGEYPIASSECILGRDILLLWPVPMAVNAYLNFKERERLAPGWLEHSPNQALQHPPNFQHAQRCPDDFEIEGKVEMRDLTLAQRLFIASLMPNLPPFALRQSPDDWCKRLCVSDAKNFELAVASVSDQWRMRPVNANGVFPPDLVARIEASKVPKRKRGRRVTLDLPDELVARIACIRISEDMGSIKQMCATVAKLGAISHQFRACTHEVLERMLVRVQDCPYTIMHAGANRDNPKRVQQILWAAGLTLRFAFALTASQQFCRDCPYIRARNALVQGELNGGQPTGAQRRAILWD